MTAQVLTNDTLLRLRQSSTITEQEVVIVEGDLYYAKNVLTNEKRMISSDIILNASQNESVNETVKRQLLKG
tara:strand:- start:556 stop:771 length:216 start_codon:yes stop_codon:yes gene_type:complete